MFLAVRISMIPKKNESSRDIPVNVAELVLAQAALQADGDIKRSTSGDSASDTRHGDNRDVLHLDIGRGLGYEHEALIQKVQKTLVGLDGALDAMVAVVAVVTLEMLLRYGLSVTDLRKSLEGMMTFFPDKPRKTLVTT